MIVTPIIAGLCFLYITIVLMVAERTQTNFCSSTKPERTKRYAKSNPEWLHPI